MDEHHKMIIEKTKIFVGKIDGDDISIIWRLIDDLIFEDTTNKYFDLVDDLNKIMNAMYCEYGCDYGEVQKDWDDVALQILEIFSTGYNKNEEDLNKLISIIEDGIKN